MNEQEQGLQELEIYGFTILESVVDTDTADAMRETLIRCAEDHGTEHTHRGSARHVSNLPVLDRIFHQCIDHPRVLPLLEHFLQPSLILGSLNSRIVRPGDGYQGINAVFVSPASEGAKAFELQVLEGFLPSVLKVYPCSKTF